MVSAPQPAASSSLAAVGAATVTRAAPAAVSSWDKMSPVGPAPKISASQPACGASTSMPCRAQAVGSASTATSGPRSPARWQLTAGTLRYSAKPPSSNTPMARSEAQNAGRARRHMAQVPQDTMLSTATSSPGGRPSAAPSAARSTTPITSCPGTSG
jgi:hypothetical protein